MDECWVMKVYGFCLRHVLIRQHWASVELLRHAAENTVAHLVLTVFSHLGLDQSSHIDERNNINVVVVIVRGETVRGVRAHVSVYDDCITISWNITRNNINRAFSLFLGYAIDRHDARTQVR